MLDLQRRERVRFGEVAVGMNTLNRAEFGRHLDEVRTTPGVTEDRPRPARPGSVQERRQWPEPNAGKRDNLRIQRSPVGP